MAKKQVTSEWTGIKGKIMAWGLNTPLRRLETLFVGDYRSAFLNEVSNIIKGNEVILDIGDSFDQSWFKKCESQTGKTIYYRTG